MWHCCRFVAKRYGQSSVLGSYLDPLADKALIGCVVGALGYQVSQIAFLLSDRNPDMPILFTDKALIGYQVSQCTRHAA